MGIILGIISSSFAALYTIYNERLVNIYDSKILNYYQMLGGTIVLGLLLPIYYYYHSEENFLLNLSDTVNLILLALFCTVMLYVYFPVIKTLNELTQKTD